MDKPPGDRDGRPPRPRARKPAGPPEPAAVEKVKSTIHLTAEASRRLGIHCAMTGLDRSATVERLINEHLRRYVVSDRGGPAAPPLRVADDGDGPGRRESA